MNPGSKFESDTAEEVLKKYGNSILRLAFSYLKSIADAEDILQETLLKYIQKSMEYESEEHEKAWLFRVAANLCKNRLKSPWRRNDELSEDIPVGDMENPCEQSEVLTAVMKLPVKYREVIHLFYYEDYSSAEISRILKKPDSTVRTLLARGRGILKEALKEAYDFYE